MAALEFPCPHCSLKLRARDRTVAGTIIVCPDCRNELLIEEEGNGDLIAREREIVSPLSAPAPQPPAPFHPERVRRTNPVIWIAAAGGVVLLIVLIAIVSPSSQDNDSEYYAEPGPVAEADETEASPNEVIDPAGAAGENAIDTRLFHEPRDIIQQHLAATGRLPAQSTEGPEDPGRRFSWIAALEAFRDPDRLEPLWDRPWDDPLNEHFVRRSLPHWINPAVSPKTSPNKFPATHIAGVAGAGPDAAELLRSHERAGVFGHKGTASIQDLGDGASNVWMISGVQREIGAWAAGGRATIRPWTKGPIIGGPDGFGTGNPDAMPILMADGSIRTISADTDPEVLTKLAAIRSHRPSDIANPNQVAGTLSGTTPDGQAMPQFQFDPLRAPKPPEAELAGLLASLQKDLKAEAEQPAIDVEKQLAQKLLLFDQPQSQPVRELLNQLQEMIAVPIEVDPASLGAAADRLDDRVRISLIEPTLKELLEKLLYRAKLGYRIEKNKIVITPEPLQLEVPE